MQYIILTRRFRFHHMAYVNLVGLFFLFILMTKVLSWLSAKLGIYLNLSVAFGRVHFASKFVHRIAQSGYIAYFCFRIFGLSPTRRSFPI